MACLPKSWQSHSTSRGRPLLACKGSHLTLNWLAVLGVCKKLATAGSLGRGEVADVGVWLSDASEGCCCPD